MYKVTWNDKHTGNNGSINLHTAIGAKLVADTLNRQPHRYRDITVRRIARRRFNELLMTFEKL